MVVSAILTTALAPITGALFGASYGTSIRIGYEIIFPALFGDVINDQKNNPTKLQEEGTKRTIESMHKMFTGVGGAAAMEFGIEQGIEMAKKKTESPDVQDMIDLSLGLTNRQLNKRGKSQQFQDPIKDEEDFSSKIEDAPFKGGDFLNLSHDEILAVFNAAPHRDLKDLLTAFLAEGHDAIITYKVRQLYNKLIKEKAPDTPEEAIKKATPEGSQTRKIASLYRFIPILVNKLKNIKLQNLSPALKNKTVELLFAAIGEYNRYVQSVGKSKLSIDSAKTLQQLRIVPR